MCSRWECVSTPPLWTRQFTPSTLAKLIHIHVNRTHRILFWMFRWTVTSIRSCLNCLNLTDTLDDRWCILAWFVCISEQHGQFRLRFVALHSLPTDSESEAFLYTSVNQTAMLGNNIYSWKTTKLQPNLTCRKYLHRENNFVVHTEQFISEKNYFQLMTRGTSN